MKKALAIALSAIMVLSVSPLAMAGEYVVKKGDNLSKIAPMYKTTWRELAKTNKLSDPNMIFPGQMLIVPDVAEGMPAVPTVPAVPAPTVPAPTVPVVEPPAVTESISLTSLKVDDITLTGNAITPEFDAKINEYTMNVQSDIYSVKVTPVAPEGATVTVNEVAVEAGKSTVVKLADTYEFYGVDYTLPIKIVVTKGDATATYTVNVVRENKADVYAMFEEKVFEDKETGLKMPYEIYVPKNYDKTKKYPVVFALHGSGQRAQTTDMVLKRYEMATVWAQDSEMGVNECIVLAPQCSSKEDKDNWTSLMTFRSGDAKTAFELTNHSIAAYNLLVKTMADYSVDTSRVYMTGLSAGGFAAYSIAAKHPETFAAIVPICGGADPATIEALKGIPMWIFHAEDDPTVSVEEFLKPTIAALDKAGITYKSTIYTAGEVFAPSAHFSWTPAYANEEMRKWLFEQKKVK